MITCNLPWRKGSQKRSTRLVKSRQIMTIKLFNLLQKNYKMIAMIMARKKSQCRKGKSRHPQHKTFQSEYKHPRKFLNQVLYESNGQEELLILGKMANKVQPEWHVMFIDKLHISHCVKWLNNILLICSLSSNNILNILSRKMKEYY